MKKHIALLVMMTLVFWSCGDDDTSNNNQEPLVSLEIDGVLHTLIPEPSALSNGGRFLAISAIEEGTGDRIDIRLGSFNNEDAALLVEQDYVIEGGETAVVYGFDVINTFPNTEYILLSENYSGGQISITSLEMENNTISGLFSGTASNGVEEFIITNGMFTNIEYTFYD